MAADLTQNICEICDEEYDKMCNIDVDMSQKDFNVDIYNYERECTYFFKCNDAYMELKQSDTNKHLPLEFKELNNEDFQYQYIQNINNIKIESKKKDLIGFTCDFKKIGSFKCGLNKDYSLNETPLLSWFEYLYKASKIEINVKDYTDHINNLLTGLKKDGIKDNTNNDFLTSISTIQQQQQQQQQQPQQKELLQYLDNQTKSLFKNEDHKSILNFNIYYINAMLGIKNQDIHKLLLGPCYLLLEKLYDDIPYAIDKQVALIDNIAQNQKSYSNINKFSAKKDDKFIIIGDIHGSLSTLLLHILRWIELGYMDKNCKLINNYKIIFLGDIIDYSIFDYPTLLIVLELMNINSSNVIYNSGNHENMNVNLSNQYKYQDKLIPRLKLFDKFKDKISNSIVDLFKNLHLAQLIKHPDHDRYVYLSHGGLPINKEGKLCDITTNIELSQNEQTSILWGDFYNYKELIPDNITRNEKDNSGINVQGTNVLEDCYKKNIYLHIRGHYDITHDGIMILKKLNKDDEDDKKDMADKETLMGILDASQKKLTAELPLKHKHKSWRLATDTKSIYLNGKDKTQDFHPVITLATCITKNEYQNENFAVLSF